LIRPAMPSSINVPLVASETVSPREAACAAISKI
jgi:hypothetical protein